MKIIPFLRRMKFWIFKIYFRFFLNMFYREVDVIDADVNVPNQGPCIFVGNHQNQFVDAVMLFSHCKRDVGFLMAKKSFKRFWVGFFARLMGCIPVVRAADDAKTGKGMISSFEGSSQLIGENTEFTVQVKAGDSIVWRCAGYGEVNLVVLNVLSDTRVSVSGTLNPAWIKDGPCNYKIFPKVDHTEMYDSVYNTLKDGGAVGIFPEGGSHDRTRLLPFKSGCAVFALGATKHGVRPVIVPFGLTYFHGHHFRSRAHLEFGDNIHITDELVELYEKDSKAAIKKLMKQIEDSIYDVTTNFNSYDELKVIHSMRQLYVPCTLSLHSGEYLRIIRRLAQAYDKVREHPKIKKLSEKISHYQLLTESFWMVDAQVETIPELKHVKSLRWLLVRSVFLLVFFLILALPGYLINLPIVIIAKLVSIQGAKHALAGSSVKVAGRDVIASYKIITMMSAGPLLYCVYLLIGILIFGAPWGALVIPVLFTATYISLHAIKETVYRFKSLIPFFLWLSFKRYRRMFDALYTTRRDLEKEVRQVVGELGPELGDKLWSQHSQALFELIRKEEERLQKRDDEEMQRDPLRRLPFQAKHQSRLRPPMASQRFLNRITQAMWMLRMKQMDIYSIVNWDYFAFPTLMASPSVSSSSSFENLASLEEDPLVTSIGYKETAACWDTDRDNLESPKSCQKLSNLSKLESCRTDVRIIKCSECCKLQYHEIQDNIKTIMGPSSCSCGATITVHGELGAYTEPLINSCA